MFGSRASISSFSESGKLTNRAWMSGKSFSNLCSMLICPSHLVQLGFRGRSWVVARSLPDSLSVDSLDMSLLTCSVIVARWKSMYFWTARLRRWLAQPTKGFPSLPARALFALQLSPMMQIRLSMDRSYQFKVDSIKAAWLAALKQVSSSKGENASKYMSGLTEASSAGNEINRPWV